MLEVILKDIILLILSSLLFDNMNLLLLLFLSTKNKIAKLYSLIGQTPFKFY